MMISKGESVNSEIETVDEATALDLTFFALSDSIRRDILVRVKNEAMTVSELARPFDISMQAVSRHIHVLVKAGLVHQERTGRISRCHLNAGPIYEAAVWLNQYSQYWQEQFDSLKGWLEDIDRRGQQPPTSTHKKGDKT